MKKQTDDLVKRAKRYESEAFTELMQLYMTDMYKVAYAILMNDEDAAAKKGADVDLHSIMGLPRASILISERRCREKISGMLSVSPRRAW